MTPGGKNEPLHSGIYRQLFITDVNYLMISTGIYTVTSPNSTGLILTLLFSGPHKESPDFRKL